MLNGTKHTSLFVVPLHQPLFLANATKNMPTLKKLYDKVSKTCGCFVDE